MRLYARKRQRLHDNDMHVDDLLTGGNKSVLEKQREIFMSRFKMTDLGEVTVILRMEIERDRKVQTLQISLRNYTLHILERFGMADYNPVSTPGIGAELSSKQPEEDYLDEDGTKRYQAMVGALLYPSQWTRYDISYEVQQLT